MGTQKPEREEEESGHTGSLAAGVNPDGTKGGGPDQRVPKPHGRTWGFNLEPQEATNGGR